MSETMVDDADEGPLEPVREMVRQMIQQKKDYIRTAQEAAAAATARAAQLTRDSQEELAELHQLELALTRLEGDGRGE